MENNRGFIGRALGLFNVNIAGSNGGRLESDNPLLHKSARGMHLPDYTPLSQLWDWYLQGCLNSNDDLRCRRNRYEDLDFMVKNSPLVKAAVDLFADEAVQCDIGACPVRVKAKKDVQTYIADLLDQWGVTQQTVREIIWNKVLFGDAFEERNIIPYWQIILDIINLQRYITVRIKGCGGGYIMDSSIVGERIQSLLAAKGMNQRSLSQATRLTESAISRYVSGEREPRGAILLCIANALGTSVEYLKGATDDTNPQGMNEDLGTAYSILERNAASMSAEEKTKFAEVLFRANVRTLKETPFVSVSSGVSLAPLDYDDGL